MSNGIYKAIANAISEITPIAKNKRNEQQKFYYRGIDDVMNELSPILAKHRIFIYPEVINKEREERASKSGGNIISSILTVKYHFATDDGSEIIATVIGEGMDSGDKSCNKAISAAYKYACLQVFCIPTDDMEEEDKTTPPQSKSQNQNHAENKQPEKEPQKDSAVPQGGESAELKELLEEGRLNNGFVKAAENALKNGDVNTIRGILKRYKENANG